MSNISIMEKRGFFDFSNLDKAKECAEIISKSGLVPSQYIGKPNDVLVAVQYGLELGFQPLQSLQNVAVINGKPVIYGDAALALCQNSPDFEYCHETYDEKTCTAICSIKRANQDEHTKTFSKDDAIKAGLWGKNGPWKQYPERMLQMRARSWALRDKYADLLKGFSTFEEAKDIQHHSEEKVVQVKRDPAELLKSKFQEMGVQVIDVQGEVVKVEETEEEREESLNTEPLVTEEMLAEIADLVERSCTDGETVEKWIKKAKVDSLYQLTQKQGQAIIDMLIKKIAIN